MTIDGNTIADALAASVRARLREHAPVLAALTCAPDFATQRFLDLKARRARELGVTLDVIALPPGSTTERVCAAVHTHAVTADGLIVQLPLPAHIDSDAVFAELPRTRDVDGVGEEAQGALTRGEETKVLPPVVGAIRIIAEQAGYSFAGKRAIVVGEGRLVGAPAARWLRQQGALVEVLTEGTTDLAARTRSADVLVLGAGSPGLITPEMVRPGAAVFDAGTSEAAGKLAGDAAPEVAAVAGLFTPVPGGIGPVTVAVLFANLLVLVERRGRGGGNLL